MLMPLVSLEQGNVKKSKKLMKRVNIEEETHHIFWINLGTSLTFSEKMWLWWY